MPNILKWAVLFVLVICFRTVNAEVLTIDNTNKTYPLLDHFEYANLIHPPGSMVEWMGSAMSDDFLLAPPLFSSEIDTAYFYGRLQIRQLPGSDRTVWIVHLPLEITHADLILTGPGQESQTQRTGFFVPVKDRDFAPTTKANMARFQLTPGELHTLYFRVKSERKMMLPDFEWRLQNERIFYEELGNKRWYNALYIGFVLLMLIYNLILYFLAIDKAYIYYSVYLLGIVIFSFYNTGDLADCLRHGWFGKNPEWIYYFKQVVYFALLGYLAFIRTFLDLEKLMPKWDRYFKYLMWLAVPCMIADISLTTFTNFNFNYSDWITVPYSLVFVVCTFVFLIPLYKTKDKKGYFIIAGVLLMGLGILLTIGDRLQRIDFSIFYFKLGSILELIAFSLGLAYRQREVEREKQQADFALERSQLLQAQEHREAERLKELDELKSKFYTNITHEFRTPLTVADGLLNQIDGNDEVKSIIRRNNNELSNLIDQILDLSRLDSGMFRANFEQLDVVREIRLLTENFIPYAKTKGISLKLTADPDQIIMDADREILSKIINNLISNALKFTPAGERIEVKVSRGPANVSDQLQIAVTDTGLGIAAEDHNRIFDRFQQLAQQHNHLAGSGIGLALVKDLVKMLEGDISVESKPQSGSTFTILLPIHQQANLPTTEPAKSGARKDTEHMNPIDPGEFQQANSDDERQIILLVEDHPDILYYLQNLLGNDYQLLMATDGKKGLQLALKTIPDLIISDIMMPHMDGYEMTGRLKSDERTSHIPVILLTAKSAVNHRISGWQHGADAYLTKPFQPEELTSQVINLLEAQVRLRNYYNSEINQPGTLTDEQPMSLDEIFLEKINTQIFNNIDNGQFSVERLAAAVNLSQPQVYRKLKALTGRSPSSYIRSIRLKEGLRLIQNSPMTISEVAFQVGFNDPSYFTRVFTEEFGVPPREMKTR